MPWVRFDDQFTVHRKVRGLTDSAFRLHTEGIFWCARNLTNGFVAAEDLHALATARRPAKTVPELVSRGNWHEATSVCDSEKCPAHVDNRRHAVSNGVTGWLIHDYFEYQPTKARVLKDREANAGRQRKHRDQQKREEAESGSESNAVSNAVTPGVSTNTPSRPVPSRRDGSSLGDQHAGDQSVRAGARVREARRWLHDRYRLTDDEADQVITQAQARSAKPIRHPVKYLAGMAEGDLADIVSAVMDAGRSAPEPPHTVLWGPLAVVPDPPEEAEPAEPNAAFLEAKARISRRGAP